MKKKLQVSVYAIIIILIVVFFIFYYLTKNNVENECQAGSDCVKIQTTCCPCSSGGEEKCVPKYEMRLYKDELENCPRPNQLICSAVYNCKIENCLCIKGKCSE